ncbi:MAG: hypothetical protein ACI9U2_002451 [Bradymonadia bacterium]
MGGLTEWSHLIRLHLRLHLVLGLLLLSAVGCDDGSSSEPLDCAWLAGDNCCKRSLREVPACAPGDEIVGVFNADLTTCTYDDGTVINFNIPAIRFQQPRDGFCSGSRRNPEPSGSLIRARTCAASRIAFGRQRRAQAWPLKP